MITGWRRQMLSRNLSFATVDAQQRIVRRFHAYTDAHPWKWSPGDLEKWTAELRTDGGLARSTVRSYQHAIRHFLDYVTDARYGWVEECARRFDTHPVQICSEWNMAVHATDY
jgi:hypothetical protein